MHFQRNPIGPVSTSHEHCSHKRIISNSKLLKTRTVNIQNLSREIKIYSIFSPTKMTDSSSNRNDDSNESSNGNNDTYQSNIDFTVVNYLLDNAESVTRSHRTEPNNSSDYLSNQVTFVENYSGYDGDDNRQNTRFTNEDFSPESNSNPTLLDAYTCNKSENGSYQGDVFQDQEFSILDMENYPDSDELFPMEKISWSSEFVIGNRSI